MRRFVPVWVALVLLTAASAMAQPPAKAPDITPEASSTVKAMSAFLTSQPILAFTATVEQDHVYPNGQTLQLTRLLQVTLKRPNKLFIRITGDERNRVFVYDGKTFTLADLDKGVYAVLAAPPTVDGLVTMLEDKYGLAAPMSDFLSEDPAAQLLGHVLTGEVLGTHLAAGKPCRHLFFTQKDVEWQLWVEPGKQPLPRKLVIIDKNKMGWPQYEATFTQFNFYPRLPAGLFTFTPAKGARQIELLPLAHGQGGTK